MGYVERDRLLLMCEGSIYKLVNLAAKRALEIAEGQPKLVEVNAAVKPSTVALMEIASGKVQTKKSKQKE
ncbi:MAG: DNA-directed RNA polymerase subunit omega [Candidatus Omnitrophica bacterium ADurb.Bin205]|nr:MAG: DNA-directed RNA polymerase subunit omega [Candidatus Omnitrophica bacterium ADurb.Bin205]